MLGTVAACAAAGTALVLRGCHDGPHCAATLILLAAALGVLAGLLGLVRGTAGRRGGA